MSACRHCQCGHIGVNRFIFAYIEGPASQNFSKLRTADRDSTVCDMLDDIKFIHYARNLDDKIDVIKKLPVSTETSPGGNQLKDWQEGKIYQCN